jgi:hypothetical protein
MASSSTVSKRGGEKRLLSWSLETAAASSTVIKRAESTASPNRESCLIIMVDCSQATGRKNANENRLSYIIIHGNWEGDAVFRDDDD